MLSINAMSGSGQGEYYTSLGREDYYLNGGEPPGKWYGRGSEALGLSGDTVNGESLKSLLEGCTTDGRPLTQNVGERDRQVGWDLTFSAPKPVSTLWAICHDEDKRKIQQAHDTAVSKALSYIEEEHGFTRRGKGGRIREDAQLVFAVFQHGTSRAQDPQLHSHALLMNVCVRHDGTTGSILSKPMYQSQHVGGAIYRAELSYQLEKLGFEIERDGDFFKIKDVPKSLCDDFSKRRVAIEAELDRLGLSGAKASEMATLSTRSVKGHTAREELFEKWEEVGKGFGFTKEKAEQIKRDEPISRDEAREKREAVAEALDRVTYEQSHFSERELLRRTAESAQARGIDSDAVRASVKERIAKSDELVYLGKIDHEKRYTTKEMLETEQKMIATVQAMRKETLGLKVDVAIKRDLSLEQKMALLHITEDPGKVKVVSGMAGTGKTTLMAEGRKAWEASGYTVIGASLSGKAAQGLEDGAGIKSTTLHKTLLDIEKGKLKLDDKTIFVIDEAGMVGTRQMVKVVDEVKKANAKLVLVGDEKQLQPIEAGAPFRAIGEAVGKVELKDIRRQRDEKDRKAVLDVVAGDSQKALHSYAERGLLTVSDDREKAINALIEDWKKDGVANPKGTLIITGTRLETSILNKKAQAERELQGQLQGESITIGNDRFFENDRVMITKRSPYFRVNNGDVGTIERIDQGRGLMVVALDGGEGRKATIPYKEFEHVKLGYVGTTHKFQGATDERCFVLIGGQMQDRELSYVQVSRARGETRLYTHKGEVSDTTAALARQMNKSRQKGMAIEVIQLEKVERERQQGITI